MKFYLKEKIRIWVGNTTNFVKVTVESKLDLKNKIKEVQIQSFDGENLKVLLFNYSIASESIAGSYGFLLERLSLA